MLKRLPVLLMLVFVCLLPVRAQDGCEISLLDDISQLVKAQSAADDGDTAAATTAIAEVQAHLSDILATCGQGNSALPTTFEFPDGLFRFNYPSGWAKLSPTRGVYVLGNDQTAVNSIVSSNIGEAIPAGSQIVIAAYGDVKALFNADDFNGFVDQLQQEGMAEGARFSAPTPITLNDYSAASLSVESDLYDGAAYVIDLGADNKIALFIALTPTGEYKDFKSTFESIIASMQTGKKPAPDTTATPTTPVVTQTGTPLSDITYQTPALLTEVVADADPRTAVLSPDGTQIAWYKDDAICVYAFADESSQCDPVPEIFHSTPLVILWSPDSHYIAFTQDAFIRFDEPDIWVYNVAAHTYSNRTDDNINKLSISGDVDPADSKGPLWYDHTFTWGADNNIYFIRFEAPVAAEFGSGSTSLYRIAPESGDAELVRELPFDRFTIYQGREYELKGAMAISPDGTQIALVVNGVSQDSPDNGVWVMPLSGQEAPTQVVQSKDLVEGTIQAFRDQGGFLFPLNVGWTPDGTGLYVYASNPNFQAGANTILYHVQIDSGVITPLVDFSAYTMEELMTVDDEGRAPIDILPRAAVMSPDGTTPVMLNAGLSSPHAGLTTLSLTANGVEQNTLIDFDYKPQPGQVSSVSLDGKMLMAGVLFLPQQ